MPVVLYMYDGEAGGAPSSYSCQLYTLAHASQDFSYLPRRARRRGHHRQRRPQQRQLLGGGGGADRPRRGDPRGSTARSYAGASQQAERRRSREGTHAAHAGGALAHVNATSQSSSISSTHGGGDRHDNSHSYIYEPQVSHCYASTYQFGGPQGRADGGWIGETLSTCQHAPYAVRKASQSIL